jgi:hypothetical protein
MLQFAPFRAIKRMHIVSSCSKERFFQLEIILNMRRTSYQQTGSSISRPHLKLQIPILVQSFESLAIAIYLKFDAEDWQDIIIPPPRYTSASVPSTLNRSDQSDHSTPSLLL